MPLLSATPLDLDDLLGEAKCKADEFSGAMTARTRDLIDSMAALAAMATEADKPRAAKGSSRKAQEMGDLKAQEAGEGEGALPASLTPRLVELLAPQAPQPAELTELHSGLESLQSTLGAAYMLLAAEAKAETLQEGLSEARGDLATTVSAGEEMLAAHQRCVDDYSELRAIVESARTDAERLAASLSENGGSEESRALCDALLKRLGSSGVPTDSTAADGDAESSESSMKKRLAEAEEHQRAVAAQLHSREAQLTLVRQELLTVDAERERYVGIVSDASAKLAAAAGAPGERTARVMGKRSKAAEVAMAKEETRLEDLLHRCVRAASEWKHAEGTGGGGGGGEGGDGSEEAPDAAVWGDGASVLREQTNRLASPVAEEGGRRKSASSQKGNKDDESYAMSKQRRLARQAAAEEAKRLANAALKEARELSRRRAELSGVNGTLREMLSALELERSARMQLQENFARDWTMQSAALKRCFHEQDVVLEVALHKLELHGGAELADALSYKLQKLRSRLAELVEDEAVVEARQAQRESALHAFTAHVGGRARARQQKESKTVVPVAIASALSSVQSFFAGGERRRKRRGSGGSGHRAKAAVEADASKETETPATDAADAANAAAGGASSAAEEVERLGAMAKSVLEHLHSSVLAAAASE